MHHHQKENPMDRMFDTKTTVFLEGKIEWMEERGEYLNLTIKDVTIFSSFGTYNCKKVLVITKEGQSFSIGNQIQGKGTLYQFVKPTNLGQFNEALYYKIRFIDYKLQADNMTLIHSDSSPYIQFLYSLRGKLSHIFKTILPEKEAGMISAMTLGDKSLLDPELNELYKLSGISHLISISGLHVSLIGVVIIGILKLLPCPPIISTALSMFLLYSYGILTNFSVSTNRAIIMIFVLMTGKVIGRTYDLLSAASLSALFILLQSPLEIYNGGFLLSFGAILGIALIDPILQQFLSLKNGVIKAITICISIQLMITPITLYYFYEIPTYGILVNLLVLPFSSLLIILGVGCGILGLIFLPMGEFFIGGVYFILQFYESVSEFFINLPKSSILLGQPPLYGMIAYYFVLFLFILANNKKKKRYTFIFLFFLSIIAIKPKSQLEIVFMDVGQGDGIFMKTPGNTTYFIDGGSSSIKGLGGKRIVPFLKAKGIWKLNYVFLTHMDTDHISGILEILETMKEGRKEYYSNSIWIERLVLPDIKAMEEEYKEVITISEELGIEVLYIKKGDIIMDGEVIIGCLHPMVNFSTNNKNASSTVLHVTFNQFSMLLTGDVEKEGEAALIQTLKNKEYSKNHLSVLKVAHHGSKHSTAAEFLELTNPRYSIISSSKNNSYGHPHIELLDRLKEYESHIYATMESGAIHIETDGKRMKIYQFLMFKKFLNF